MGEKRNRYIAAGLTALAVCGSVIFVSVHPDALAEAVLSDIFISFALMIWVMAAALRSSLRETLYSYRNIGLIGGILYVFIMELAILPALISALRSSGLTLSTIYRSLLSFPRQFSYYAVFFMVALCLLLGVSNIALIRHEGLCLNNALSLLLAVFYIGGTWAVYAASDLLAEKVFNGRAQLLPMVLNTVIPLFLLLMLCYFECILVGSAVMGWLAAHERPDHDKDYIIILGCSIDKRGGLLPLLKGRVNRAIRFAWEQEIATGRQVRYVPSGGQGANEVMSEGSAMELYLLSHGAEDYEVFPEKRSVNTWENMCFSKKIIDELKPGARIAFATTNYHMLRSGILARRAGIDAQGVAGDTKWYFWPNGFIREFFGILTLNIKAHVWVAAISAVACTVMGFIGYYAALI